MTVNCNNEDFFLLIEIPKNLEMQNRQEHQKCNLYQIKSAINQYVVTTVGWSTKTANNRKLHPIINFKLLIYFLIKLLNKLNY